MLSAEISETSGILPNSKKIKKLKLEKELCSEEKLSSPDNDGKKYKTVDSITKKRILLDLKKTIVTIKNLDFRPEELSTPELLELLEEIELTAYNKLLAQVLAQHFPNFEATTKNLTQWRRKIKGWVNSADKPENRGGLLIAHDKLQIFRQRVINILQNMKARVFPELRNKILAILEEFHYAGKDPATVKEFNRNTCSKHWWFNFMRRNSDIKDLWEGIPLERMVTKDRAGSDHKSKDLSTDISPSHYPIDSSLEAGLTIPNPYRMDLEPVIKIPAFMSGLKGLGHDGPQIDAIIKKEEEMRMPLTTISALSTAPSSQEIMPKLEETKILSVPIVTKNEDDNTKMEAETITQPNTRVPVPQQPQQMDYLGMLLQRRRMIDMLILMQLNEKMGANGNGVNVPPKMKTN